VNRIIFFLIYPLSQRDYDRFGFELLRKNGFVVEAWNFLPILNPEVSSQHAGEKLDVQGNYTFENFDQVEEAISRLTSSDFLVLLFGYTYSTRKIYLALSKKSVNYAVFTANALPPFQGLAESIGFIDRVRSSLSWQKIKYYGRLSLWQDYIFSKSPFKYRDVKPARYVLAGGSDSYREGSFPSDEGTEILWFHSLDYDIYLNSLESEKKTRDGRTAVFLDEYYPFHPDFAYANLKAPVSSEKYYPQLCHFFKGLEEYFDLNVVIAAHPRSEYDKLPDYFDGRKVIKGKTVDLVRDSELVLTHASTSISYPVLFRKPVFFLTDDEQNEGRYGDGVRTMAALFERTPINVSKDWSLNESDLEIDEDAYANYRERYIKRRESEALPFWELFSLRLRRDGGADHVHMELT
jgi:hypothetical protein